MTDTIGPLLLDSYRDGRSRGAIDYRINDAGIDDNPYDPEFQPHAHRGWSDGWRWRVDHAQRKLNPAQ